jgi:6-phosphogluconolactonase
MEYFFENREEASLAAAKRIVKALQRRLDGNGKASVVVSGGTSPARCFANLAESQAVDWSRVHVVLSDERWVPPDHDDSNEKLVRETLITGAARDASLLPVFRRDIDAAGRCKELDEELLSVPFPFACVLLGMGEDGHFASLFPDASNLDEGLVTDSKQLCIPVRTAASSHLRISLTLAALSRSDEVLLLIFGDAKREIYEAAKATAGTFPVSRLLKQKRAPVRVYWAP